MALIIPDLLLFYLSHGNRKQRVNKSGLKRQDLNDLYWCLVQKRLEDIRAGRSKTIALDEVMKRHGMER